MGIWKGKEKRKNSARKEARVCIESKTVENLSRNQKEASHSHCVHGERERERERTWRRKTLRTSGDWGGGGGRWDRDGANSGVILLSLDEAHRSRTRNASTLLEIRLLFSIRCLDGVPLPSCALEWRWSTRPWRRCSERERERRRETFLLVLVRAILARPRVTNGQGRWDDTTSTP